jgi:hypothetical protein
MAKATAATTTTPANENSGMTTSGHRAHPTATSLGSPAR